MVITAPGLFSTMTCQPSLSDNSAATTRLIMSGGVLGAVGTTIRMGFDGNDWATASESGLRMLAVAKTNPVDTRRRSNW